MTPKESELATLLLPIPLVAALTLPDAGHLISAAGRLAIPSAIVLALSAASLIIGLSFFIPGTKSMTFGPAKLIIAAAVLLYLGGSVLGNVDLHLPAVALLYVGVASYLGGSALSRVLIPPLLGVAGLAAALALTGPLSVWIIYVAAFMLLGYSIVLLFLRRRVKLSSCSFCESYRSRLEPFCAYCGTMTNPTQIKANRRTIAKVAAFSAVLILLSAASLPIITLGHSEINQPGLSIAGVHGNSIFPSLPGWFVVRSQAGTNHSVSTFLYTLQNEEGQNVTLGAAISPSAGDPVKIFSAKLTNFSSAGSFRTTNNDTLMTYAWSTNGQPYIGLLGSSRIRLLSSGSASFISLHYVIGEQRRDDINNQVQQLTGLLGSVDSSTVRGWQYDLAWSIVAFVGSSAVGALQYMPIVLVLIGLLSIAAVARLGDIPNTRLSDNSLGLDRREFSLLALIASSNRLRRGSELLGIGSRMSTYDLDWWEFSAKLRRLGQLGFLDTVVVVRGGTPSLYWKSRVS